MNRRTFIATSAGVGTGLLAGCAARDESDERNSMDESDTDEHSDEQESDGSDDDTGDSTEPAVGTFRFLISDRPVAIDDFDSLDVSFSTVRIFRGDGAEEDDAGDSEEEQDAETEDQEQEETEEQEEGTEEEQDPEEGDEDSEEEEAQENEQEGETEDVENNQEADEPDEQRGFVEFDLDGATVDLTTVIGDKATPILENELEEGTYSKIELQTSDVEGVVNGESVHVKIPSEKLQIVKPFEVRAGESLSFVFDINVVKKGPRDEYNLLPVIGESGVVGQDVDAKEIEQDDKEDDNVEETEDEEEESEEDGEGDEDKETEEGGDSTESQSDE